MKTAQRPAWEEIVAHVPELNELLEELIARRRRGRRSAWYHYEAVKAYVAKRVGWGSGKDGWLGSSEAFETAMRVITEALGV